MNQFDGKDAETKLLLCKEYYSATGRTSETLCDGCPIYRFTGEKMCRNTPIGKLVNLFRNDERVFEGNPIANIDLLTEAVEEVIGFLIKVKNSVYTQPCPPPKKSDIVQSVIIKTKRLPHAVQPPTKMTPGSSGFDVYAAIDSDETITFDSGEWVSIPTGLCFEIPIGYEIQIRPRSGLAINRGITIMNSPGSIDADFRGEVKIILINHSNQPFSINRGDRIAQLVPAQLQYATFEETEELGTTERGDGGFGHTGINTTN